MPEVPDVARVRLDNALRLFDEFVRATVRSADAATLRGLERRFAERLLVQPSYWSQIKAGSRQIGERLARQFERQFKKPNGWLDLPAATAQAPSAADAMVAPSGMAPVGPGADRARDTLPQDDDERFIVGLVLTYYRRHPSKARHRLLDLLGEVLQAPAAPAPMAARTARPPSAPDSAAPGRPVRPGASGQARVPAAGQPAQAHPQADEMALWSKVQAGVAPLKRKP